MTRAPLSEAAAGVLDRITREQLTVFVANRRAQRFYCIRSPPTTGGRVEWRAPGAAVRELIDAGAIAAGEPVDSDFLGRVVPYAPTSAAPQCQPETSDSPA